MSKRLFFATTFLILILVCVRASVHAATVNVQIGSAQGEKGGAVQIPIQLGGASGIGAMHLEITYDARVVQPVSVERGALAGSNALVESNLKQAGRIIIGVVSLDGIQGDGVLANIKFNVVGDAGMTGALTPENARAWETKTHYEILVKPAAGQVSVTAASPPWLLIGAIVAVILLLLLLLFWLLRRRKKNPVPASVPAPAPVSYAPPPGAPPANVPERGGDAGWACPRCKTVNRATSRFCKTCGAAQP